MKIGKQYVTARGLLTFAGDMEIDIECYICRRRDERRNETKYIFVAGALENPTEQFHIGAGCLRKFITRESAGIPDPCRD